MTTTALAAVAALLLVAVVMAGIGAADLRAAVTPGSAAVPLPGSATVSFVVALRSFEERDVALADQAASQSSSPAVRAAAGQLVAHNHDVGGRLWALLDRWDVPGPRRGWRHLGPRLGPWGCPLRGPLGPWGLPAQAAASVLSRW